MGNRPADLRLVEVEDQVAPGMDHVESPDAFPATRRVGPGERPPCGLGCGRPIGGVILRPQVRREEEERQCEPECGPTAIA